MITFKQLLAGCMTAVLILGSLPMMGGDFDGIVSQWAKQNGRHIPKAKAGSSPSVAEQAQSAQQQPTTDAQTRTGRELGHHDQLQKAEQARKDQQYGQKQAAEIYPKAYDMNNQDVLQPVLADILQAAYNRGITIESTQAANKHNICLNEGNFSLGYVQIKFSDNFYYHKQLDRALDTFANTADTTEDEAAIRSLKRKFTAILAKKIHDSSHACPASSSSDDDVDYAAFIKSYLEQEFAFAQKTNNAMRKEGVEICLQSLKKIKTNSFTYWGGLISALSFTLGALTLKSIEPHHGAPSKYNVKAYVPLALGFAAIPTIWGAVMIKNAFTTDTDTCNFEHVMKCNRRAFLGTVGVSCGLALAGLASLFGYEAYAR